MVENEKLHNIVTNHSKLAIAVSLQVKSNCNLSLKVNVE